MPRLITCIDQGFGEEPILDSQAFWVRLPDGTRARDGSGKLLAFRNRENASAEAKAINAYLKENKLEATAVAIPPETHEYSHVVGRATVPAKNAAELAGRDARPTV